MNEACTDILEIPINQCFFFFKLNFKTYLVTRYEINWNF